MALLMDGFSNDLHKDLFGDYSDFLCYVPTSFEKEIDILLIFNNPEQPDSTIAYNIIEVKKGNFDEKALSQLLQYEDWFLRKRVNGDYNMVRTTAVAGSFSDKVKEYLEKRKQYEGKEVTLLKYNNTETGLQLHKEETAGQE